MLLLAVACASGAPGAQAAQDSSCAKRKMGPELFKAETGMTAEDVWVRQSYLVEKAVTALQPQRPGKTDLYYVGFAGDAEEQVFYNDVGAARYVLEKRFGAAGRSLLLVNNTDTLYTTPVANAHNLEAALQGVAGRMDKQEDVLFLFLSSHGAQDHRLSVQFPPLRIDDLSAEELKAMLDRSGIRNRVIVVAACYSGGFLDVLQDDNTLVLTASSRNHVAYGCGDVTRYTQFTEAYFVSALLKGGSFIQAFGEARHWIEEREAGMDRSQPQIYVGRNIGKVLQRLEMAP